MVRIHSVGGNAKSSYGVYMSAALINRAKWVNGDSLRITAVDPDIILITHEQMSTERWIELYNAATRGRPVEQMNPAELVQLLAATEGDDGRRPSSVTSLAPLGEAGHRILITDAAKRLELEPGDRVHRRSENGVVVIVPTSKLTDEVKKRIEKVLAV
ncbi:hypothetical protein JCM30237_05990 [Halolamina litorea]|uniref:Uncharacterized protein n=1 Tax=Halolamina litorea TaxID=1515593 RepID=A0ABD6BQU9_9EURY|nr:hypothetical protein [Halolamina litorea]